MKRRTAFVVVFALWSIMFCFAAGLAGARGPLEENEIRTLVSEAPDESERPDAEALILFDGTYLVYEDGMVSVRRQRLVKVYTEYAIDEVGDPRLAYDRDRQELEVHASRTYLLDGTTMDTPDNGYNEVTPFGLDRSLDHLDIREMVVSHVGIERGVSILLDWTIRDTAPAGVPFSRLFMVFDEFPTLEREVVAEGDLYGEAVNPQASGFRIAAPDKQDGKLVWHMTNLPRRPYHAGRRLGDQVPWIAVSSAPTWKSLLVEIGRTVAAGSASREHLESVLHDMEEEQPYIGERESLERIVEAVGERTHAVTYRPWLFSPLARSADRSIMTSSATPLERSLLVIAASEVMGLGADLILPAEWAGLTDRVPALEALGDPLVRVAGSEGTWFVEPVSARLTMQPPTKGGLPYFVVSGDWSDGGPVGVELVSTPMRTNDIRLSAFWDLETGEAQAEGAIRGPLVSGLAREEPVRLLEGWVRDWSDSAEAADVRVLESSQEDLAYSVSLDAPLPSPDERGRILVELPMPPCDLSDLLPPNLDPARSKSDGMLFPPAPSEVRLVWKVRLPEDYRLLAGEDRRIRLEGGSLLIERTAHTDLVEVTCGFGWDGRPVLPDDYAEYRELVLDLLDRRLKRLVFAEEAASPE